MKIIAIVCLAFSLVSCRLEIAEYTFVQYNVGVFDKYDSSSVEAVARAVREMGADAVTLNEVDSCTTRTDKVTVKHASIPQTLQSADLTTASDHLPVVLTVAIE